LAEALEQIRVMEAAEKQPVNTVEACLEKGPLVYELFSVLIHSGSAMGGHYYAYIKSFEDGQWYNFNDTNVQLIPESDVQSELTKMFGGGSDARTSSYMLQYRRHDLNGDKPNSGEIPAYLLDEINQEA
jgi:ubiquitin carboxyl-terminal hydrolase 47